MPPTERQRLPDILWVRAEGEEESVIIDFAGTGIVPLWEPPPDPSKAILDWAEEIKRSISGSTQALLEAMGEHDRAEGERTEVATAKIIEKLEQANKGLEERLDRISEQNRALRRELLLSTPYIRWLRFSLAATAVFVFSLLVWFLRGAVIISPTVSLIGAALSVGFVIMSLLFKRDWPHPTEEEPQ